MQHAKKCIKKNKDNRFLMHTGCIRMCVAAESQRNCTAVHCVKKWRLRLCEARVHEKRQQPVLFFLWRMKCQEYGHSSMMKQKGSDSANCKGNAAANKTQGWQSMVMGMDSSECEKCSSKKFWTTAHAKEIFPYSSKGNCNEFVVHWIEMQYMQQQWV